MSKLTKSQVEQRLAKALEHHFKASGKTYTCAAVAIAEIEGPAESYAAKVQAEGYKIKARRLINLALERIHEKRPK